MQENRKIIDVHAHLGDSLSFDLGGKAENLIEIMDKNDIEKAVISPIPGYPDPQGVKSTAIQNDRIAEAITKYPDRFPRGLAVLEPRHGKECLKELDRALTDLELSGIMFHNDWQAVGLSHPIMFTIFEEAKKYDIIAMVHTSSGQLEPPFAFGKIVRAFPEITFVNAHAAMSPGQLDQNIEIAKVNKNVFLDTCLIHHFWWPVEKAVKELGADRVLFGSDIPYWDQCIDRIIVENANISDEDKNKIFWNNTMTLFDIKS